MNILVNKFGAEMRARGTKTIICRIPMRIKILINHRFLNIFKASHLFFHRVSSSWLPSEPSVLKHIVKAGGGEKYISLLCFVAFFPRHYKAVMGGHREKQIAPLLTSNRPHFNVPPLRDSLLCYSQV